MKWRLFGRRLHYLEATLALVLLASEVVQTFALKSYPHLLDSQAIQAQSRSHLVLIAVLNGERLRPPSGQR